MINFFNHSNETVSFGKVHTLRKKSSNVRIIDKLLKNYTYFYLFRGKLQLYKISCYIFHMSVCMCFLLSQLTSKFNSIE